MDFSMYKENLSADAFVDIVSKAIIKDLDDITKIKLRNGITFTEAHFSYGLLIRNHYINPYLEKHRFAGKNVPDADTISMMILDKITKKVGGHITSDIL